MSAMLRFACLAIAACLFVPSLASAQMGGPDGYGMVYDTTLYDFVDITATGVALGMGDDDEFEVALPFTFEFYGVGYDWVTIADNAGLIFSDGTGPANLYGTNEALPDDSTASPDIAVLWDDQDSSPEGEAFYLDDSANGRFIVSWVDTARYQNIGMATYQVHLYADGTIQLHYADVIFDDALYDNGMSATTGIQDFTGGMASAGWALQVGYNDAYVFDMDAFVFFNVDADGDTFAAIAAGGTDCDDTDPLVNPDALEICSDGVDNNCSGYDQLTDFDLDGDVGVDCGGPDCDDFDPTVSSLIDVDGDGSSACDDCDDADPNTFPGAVELCDDIDNDCDTFGDDLLDNDADGVTACAGDCDDFEALAFPGNVEVFCDAIDNDCDDLTVDAGDADADGVTCDIDCDDLDPTIFPMAPELCDGIDSDCDGLDDANDLSIGLVLGGTVTETVVDGQAIDSAATPTVSVMTVASAVTDPVVDVNVTLNITHTWDADLDVNLISPDGTIVELFTDVGSSGDDFVATVLDDDATMSIVDGTAPFTGTYAPEGVLADFMGDAVDGDWTLEVTDDAGGDVGTLIDWTLDIGYGTVADTDGDGVVAGCGDCDDADATIFEGAPEICGDGIDQDCDLVDGLDDADGDTFIDILCGGDDCDDTNLSIFPGAPELCDTIDSDCDGLDDANDLDIGATTTASTMTTVDGQAISNTNPLTTSTIEFATALTDPVVDVNVTLNITHSWDSDLDVTLTSPAGTIVELFSDVGGSGDDFTATVLDDQAADLIGDGDAPFTGAFQPAGMLADFGGEAIDGVWTLDVTDDTGGDDGVLVDWTLDIVTGSVDDADFDGWVDTCGDCGPADATIFPGAAEICGDGIDQDCDLTDLVVDVDLDTFSDEDCGGTDCDDDDATVFPGGIEICLDGLDNDCDGVEDGVDVDGDGVAGDECGGTDCNDADATIFPGAPELCDTIDSDCDGLEDAFDTDIGTLAGTALTPGTSAPALTIDGSVDHTDVIAIAEAGAVSDVNVTVNITHTWDSDLDISLIAPDGTEVELSTDNGGSSDDYTATVFDDDAVTAIVDGDAPFTGSFTPEGDLNAVNGQDAVGDWTLKIIDDTGGDNGELIDWTIEIEVGGTSGDADFDGVADTCGDCDPADATIFLGALEICGDAIDQDCDGADDVEDFDADTFINADCGGDDCDDANLAIFPGADEVCNDFVDNDCDELTEDIFDADMDGVTCEIDCDDDNALAFPGFVELCNDAVDNDCDPATPDIGDVDGDGVTCDIDCDDTSAIIYPGAPEILCSGVDEDCDVVVDPDIDDGDSDTFNCDVDCVDDNPAINPGALEIPCDGIDNDCDTEIDTDDGANNDMDGDGSTCEVDCDDNDPNRSPDFEELCDDGVDNDCNPATDDIHDFDFDGALCTVDCDDDDALAFPGAPEICGDGLDQDCDGVADELVNDLYDLDDDDSLLIGLCSFSFDFCGQLWDTVYVQDNGRLTFGFDDQTSAESVASLLDQTPQIDALWTDLDPSVAGTVEVIEDDGVSLTVEMTGVPQFGLAGTANNFALTLYSDGTFSVLYGDLDETDGLVGWACDDIGDVLSIDITELNDDMIGQGTESAIYEQFSDLGSPNDLEDEWVDFCATSGVDADGDGWTDMCGDCDDAEATAYPGADELCGDGIDNDCDGIVDNGDLDEDGFIDEACGGTDCDDMDPDVSPAAAEICNGIDDDCDGVIEDEELDEDADGFAPCSDDCDDTDAAINPDADEICDIDDAGDGIDNDCDGDANEGFNEDLDGDGYISEDCGGDDCDDSRAGAFPGGDEICDGGDNDCDGTVDNVDQDADTFIDEACGGDDCDDANETVFPGAEEVPYDGVDNDCLEGDVEDADGDGFADVSVGGTDCDDGNAEIFPGAEEICDDELDNDCDELNDKDDEECGACADCNSSIGGKTGAQSGLLALLLVAIAGIRRRRND
jgi:MYXO-CTERM domain-containing protein